MEVDQESSSAIDKKSNTTTKQISSPQTAPAKLADTKTRKTKIAVVEEGSDGEEETGAKSDNDHDDKLEEDEGEDEIDEDDELASEE